MNWNINLAAIAAFSGMLATLLLGFLRNYLQERSIQPAPQPENESGVYSPGILKIAPGAPCPVCRHDLTGVLKTCARCEMPHHQDCWAYTRGCSIFQCGCPVAAGTTCLPCKDFLTGKVATCTACSRSYHVECWRANKKCCTAGCRSIKYETTEIPTREG